MFALTIFSLNIVWILITFLGSLLTACRKIEQTATSVLDLFPDLELAVEDNEPLLAHEFFETVKKWVGNLRESIVEAQHRNHESMLKLHNILHHEEPRVAEEVTMMNSEEILPNEPPRMEFHNLGITQPSETIPEVRAMPIN